jgi:exopolyphosphatase/guanosine-5'-triphosphate,3'-diphosphate pyrophosphatase
MRAAAIDIGTNTVLLVAVESDASGVRTLLERATITRLGEGVDRTRSLSDAARERTLACLETYARLLRDERVERVAAVGTSALRDARGGDAFLDAAERVLGVRPRVVQGAEEAELTFHGALSGLAVHGDVVVFDVGGGSTELVAGRAGSEPSISAAVSLDIGSVRLFERYGHSDPPSDEEIAAARGAVAQALRDGAPTAPADTTLVGVAGTVTTLAAIDRGLDVYDPARVHGARLERTSVERELGRLAALPLRERRRVSGLEPGRADVIVMGAAIVLEVLLWAGASSVVVSDRGVRWGVLEGLLTHQPESPRPGRFQ